MADMTGGPVEGEVGKVAAQLTNTEKLAGTVTLLNQIYSNLFN